MLDRNLNFFDSSSTGTRWTRSPCIILAPNGSQRVGYSAASLNLQVVMGVIVTLLLTEFQPVLVEAAGAGTITPEVIRVHVTDGLSQSVERYAPMSLSGPDYQLHAFDNWASAGITKTSSMTWYSGLMIGDYLWMNPSNTINLGLVKLNKHTGVMAEYSANWPTTPVVYASTATYSFVCSVFDGSWLWLIPFAANMVVRVNPADGTMTGYNGFPNSYGANKYTSATYDLKGYIWMTPCYNVFEVGQLDTTSGAMTGFPVWPVGFTWAFCAFEGAAFDGLTHWMFPRSHTWIVGINTDDGVMRGHDLSTTLAGMTCASVKFNSGVFTGPTTLYAIPWTCNGFVQVDSLSGATTIHNSWPVGMLSTPGTTQLGVGAIFDGQFIWTCTRVHSEIIRFDTLTGSMKRLVNAFPSGHSGIFAGMTVDPATQSLWFFPSSSNMLIRLTASTFTHTGTKSHTGTDTMSPTGQPTATQEPTRTATNTITSAPTGTASHVPTATWHPGMLPATHTQTADIPTPAPPTPAASAPTTTAASTAIPTTTSAPTTAVATTTSPAATTTTSAAALTSSLSLAASHTAHWTALFEVSANATSATTATHVTLEVSVMAAVILSLDSNHTTCAQSSSPARGGKGTVFCTIASLPAGQTVSIFVMANSSLSYNFNGAIVLRYKLQADNGDSAFVGKLKMLPSSYTGSAVTAAPGPAGDSPGTSNNNGRGVFGQSEGIGRCIDAFVFTTFGSLILIGVVMALTLMCLKKKEEEHCQHSATVKQQPRRIISEQDGDGANAAPPPPLEAVNTCVAIPLWRSLALQHAYCIVPCHSQCHLAHTLPLVAHVFTLMMLCATISSTFLTSDVSAVAVTVVLSILIAAGLRPLLVNTYYFRFTWIEESIRKTAITSNGRSKTSSNENLKTRLQRSRRGSGVISPEIQASMVALDNVELEEGHGGEAAGGGTITTLNGTGTELEPLEGTQSSVEDEEKETGKEAEEELDQEEEGGKDFEDDVVHLGQKKEPVELKKQEESKESNDDEHQQQQQHLVGGTIHKLAKDIDFDEGEEELEKEEEEEVRKKRSSRSDVVSIQSCSSNEDGLWRVKMIVTPHRKRGHYLVCTVLALVVLIALSVILTIETSSSCSMFETSFLTALLVDLVVVQPLIVAFSWMYRWLQSDEENNFWSELHPFDGAERDV